MNPDLAMVFMFGGNFAPQGYAMCNGQLLPITQNTALFTLLGTTYGGDGQTTFALPDLRGRVPMHVGQGPGLSPYVLGQSGGTENTTLNTNQIPAHSHPFNAVSGPATTALPAANTYLAVPLTGSGPNASQLPIYTTAANNVTLGPNAVGQAGGSQPFNNIQPYVTFTFVIALEGVFPARN